MINKHIKWLIVGALVITFAIIFLLLTNKNLDYNIASINQGKLNIHSWNSSRGVPVYFVSLPSSRLAIVDVNLSFKAGSAYDGSNFGLAQLVNEAMSAELAVKFDKLGIEYSADITRDKAEIKLRALSDKQTLKSAIEILREIISGAKFAPAAVDRIKQQQLVSIKQEIEQPRQLAKNAFFEKNYGAHPYAHAISGDLSSIQNITRTEIINFYQKYYTARNVKLTIVGDISQSHARDLAEELLAKLPMGESIEPITAVVKPIQAITENIKTNSSQAVIILGQPSIKAGDKDRFKLEVFSQILGGAFTSRMWQQIREDDGLAYVATSQLKILEQLGVFLMWVETKNSSRDLVTTKMKDILQDLYINGPTEQEVSDAKQHLIGGFANRIASNKKIANAIAHLAFYDIPMNYLDDYKDNIAGVTKDSVIAAVQRHFDLQKITLVTVSGN